MSRRPGRGLVEVVLVFWLFGLILAAVGRLAAGQNRTAEVMNQRVRLAEAVRTAWLVLGAEVRPLTRADVLPGPDSLRLRAMRGSGTVCGIEGDQILVRYAGVRLPDPAKDSVLVLDLDGASVRAADLLASAGDPACGGALRLRVAPAPAAPGAFALVFETGAYHLSGAALRYRRGAAGRQPLTETIFREPRLEERPEVLRVFLPVDPQRIHARGGGTPFLPLRLLNDRP